MRRKESEASLRNRYNSRCIDWIFKPIINLFVQKVLYYDILYFQKYILNGSRLLRHTITLKKFKNLLLIYTNSLFPCIYCVNGLWLYFNIFPGRCLVLKFAEEEEWTTEIFRGIYCAFRPPPPSHPAVKLIFPGWA